MYEKLTTIDGATAVVNYVGSTGVSTDADGLLFAPPNGNPATLTLPDRLLQWLLDIRLLRHLPVVYLVPDSALLPTESIRFFYVDPTWVDRVIDGVFSAANTGTVDSVYDYSLLSGVRNLLDSELAKLAAAAVPGSNWTPAAGITGMLIRSELASRWPDMIVECWADETMTKPMPVLRSEPVSKDIYIALFAGQPQMVTVREPFTGVRFGVEPQVPDSQTLYKVDARKLDGTNILDANQDAVPVPIVWRNSAARTINFLSLANSNQAPEHTPRQVAINLEQKPYLQEFKQSRDEELGSQELTDATPPMQFRRGRFMKLDNLRALQVQAQKAGA
jgi:hypothetical protein